MVGQVQSSLRIGVQIVPGDGDLSAEAFGDADGGVLHLTHEAGEVIARAGDGGDAEGGGLPGGGVVHFGDGDVESVGEFLFQAADDLAAILEGVGVLDAEFEKHGGDGHRRFMVTRSQEEGPVSGEPMRQGSEKLLSNAKMEG